MDVWDIYSFFSLILVAHFILRETITWSKIIYVHLLSKLFSKSKNFSQLYGKWAVITGSSSGIGMNYAKEMAKRGMNVVLLSNEEEQLHEVSKEIETSFGVETKVIVADFSLGEDEYQRIFKLLDDLEIGILINNVGTAGGLPNNLERMTRKQMWNILMINVCAATSMTHHLLPKMKISGKGLIINVASLAALSPTPNAVLYGASKAFMKSFSEAVRWECKGTGVDVQTLCPGFVDTNIIASNASLMPAMFFPQPATFVKRAVDTIGKASTTAGCLPHDIQYALQEELPLTLKTWIAKMSFSVKEEKKQ